MDCNVENLFAQTRPPKTETLTRQLNDLTTCTSGKKHLTEYQEKQTSSHHQKFGPSYDADTRVIAAVAGSLYNSVQPRSSSSILCHQQLYLTKQPHPTLCALNRDHGEETENSTIARSEGQSQKQPRPTLPWQIYPKEKQTASPSLSQICVNPLSVQKQSEVQSVEREGNVNPRSIYAWKKGSIPVSASPSEMRLPASNTSWKPLTVDISLTETPKSIFREKASLFNRSECQYRSSSNNSTNSSNPSSSNSSLLDPVTNTTTTSVKLLYSPMRMSRSSTSSPAHTPLSASSALSGMYTSMDSDLDTEACTCQRSPKLILCKSCGEMVEGRVRQMCPVHPKQIFLMDLLCCSKCKSQNLKEICSAK